MGPMDDNLNTIATMQSIAYRLRQNNKNGSRAIPGFAKGIAILQLLVRLIVRVHNAGKLHNGL